LHQPKRRAASFVSGETKSKLLVPDTCGQNISGVKTQVV
jgi:hypothetical protein